MISTYARIGRATLVRATGPKRNYKEITEKKCEECENGCGKNPALCEACKKAAVRYVNEANTYGPANKVGAIALKTLIYVHFLQPDKNGLVCLDVRDAATDFSCSRQSVINAVYVLKEKGYIEYSHSPENPSHEFFIIIKDYDKLGQRANQGGRGYIMMSRDMAAAIFSCKSLNAVRIAVRVALDTDSHDGKEYTSVNEFKKFLPTRYTTKDVLGFVDEAKRHAFKVIRLSSDKIDKRYVPLSITLKDKCVGKAAYERKVKEARQKFNDLTRELLNTMAIYNNITKILLIDGEITDDEDNKRLVAQGRLEEKGYYPLVGRLTKLYTDVRFTEEQKTDIAKIMVIYPEAMFDRVFHIFYDEYWGKADTDKNPAAIIRLIYKNFAAREEKHKALRPTDEEDKTEAKAA